MKILSVVSILLLSQVAMALPVYQCDFKAFSKSKGTVETKQALLSPQFSSDVQVGSTNLKLFVDIYGNLTGFVNDQYNFILSGDVESAKFESAADSGTIRCDSSEEVSYVLYNKSNQAYITKQLVQTAGEKVSSYDVLSDKVCFIGDSFSAAQALVVDTGAKVLSVQNLSIELELTETECLKASGDREDYQCLQESKKLVNKVIRECNETSDPRI